MAAMLTCSEFRNEKRVASLTNKLASRGTHLQRKSWEGARENTVEVRRGYEIAGSKKCGRPIAIRLVHLPRSCPKRVLCTMRSDQ